MKRGFHAQPRIPGSPRIPLSPSVMKEIDEELTHLSNMHRVSKSWVVAKILADAFHIRGQVDFPESKRKRSAA